MTSCAQPGGNIATSGRTSAAAPARSSKPAGTFIQAFASVTKNAEAAPLAATTTPLARCSRGPTRPQP